MTEQTPASPTQTQPPPAAAIGVAPAPHLAAGKLTTRRMMIDVLIGLLPVAGVAVYVFQWYAIKQLVICIAGCLAAEAVFTRMRRKPFALGDFSAAVTGAILALSLPGTAPWFVGLIGSFAAIGLGKAAFGGLGYNIFNPAMVGRAFVMVAFSQFLGAGAYQDINSPVEAVTQATPLTVAREVQAGKSAGPVTDLPTLLTGNHNGSLGEVSAIACIIGGLYLCLRRTASWEIPAGALASVALLAGAGNLMYPQAQWTVLHHLVGGALLFGAFFIATDPVSSPLTPKGKWVFGLGLGVLVMLLRTFSGYPEGVMFAVLLMNSLVPLINSWSIPRPVGGPVPARK